MRKRQNRVMRFTPDNELPEGFITIVDDEDERKRNEND